MRVENPSLPASGRLEAGRGRSQWSIAWRTFRRNRLAVAGLVVIALSACAQSPAAAPQSGAYGWERSAALVERRRDENRDRGLRESGHDDWRRQNLSMTARASRWGSHR